METGMIRLTEMITHRFDLSRVSEAFRVADDPRSSLKVMVYQ
jgi:threonine dehydrogenase-like Zn-dependent dehydrogenase